MDIIAGKVAVIAWINGVVLVSFVIGFGEYLQENVKTMPAIIACVSSVVSFFCSIWL